MSGFCKLVELHQEGSALSCPCRCLSAPSGADVDKDFLYVLGPFKGSLCLFNAYLLVFGLFLPKTGEKV